jgi:hypothetical protein
MRNTNLARRLEQLEAEVTPTNDASVLKITLTRIGKPDKTIEVRMLEPTGRGRRLWQQNGGAADDHQDSLQAIGTIRRTDSAQR